MEIVSADWSERHKKLQKTIRNPGDFARNIKTVLSLHEELHVSAVSGLASGNAVDALLEDLRENEFAVMPTAKDETIAWALWHIARIEDLTMNLLVDGGEQIFNESWRQRMRSTVSDTGNAMTDDEIMTFSRQICVSELLEYRNAVGRKSREIVGNLKPGDMKRKVLPGGTARILREGGVTEQKDSVWLLDFWGKKDVAGILLMPLTRHQTLHLNDCCKWKNAIRTKKKFFAR